MEVGGVRDMILVTQLVATVLDVLLLDLLPLSAGALQLVCSAETWGLALPFSREALLV